MLCFFQSFVASRARSEKRGGAKDRSTKFAPRARANWKPKSLKHRGFGALFEVQLRKICTTPARESDLEVNTVKNWRCRSTFES